MREQLRILVVDDIASMRRLVTAFLHELGYRQIMQAANGTEALSLLQKDAFDLVVTDWNMSRMSGLELLQTIRKDPDLKQLAVLLITTEARKENIVAAAQSGANGYVVKPFTITTLGEKVEQIFMRNQNPAMTPGA